MSSGAERPSIPLFQNLLQRAPQNLGFNEWDNSVPRASDGKLGRENILGFGFGRKFVADRPTFDKAVVLWVVQKAPIEVVQEEFLAQRIGEVVFDNRWPMDVWGFTNTLANGEPDARDDLEFMISVSPLHD